MVNSIYLLRNYKQIEGAAHSLACLHRKSVADRKFSGRRF